MTITQETGGDDLRYRLLRGEGHKRQAQSHDHGKTWSLFEAGNFPRLQLTGGVHIVMQKFSEVAARRWVETGAIDTRPETSHESKDWPFSPSPARDDTGGFHG